MQDISVRQCICTVLVSGPLDLPFLHKMWYEECLDFNYVATNRPCHVPVTTRTPFVQVSFLAQVERSQDGARSQAVDLSPMPVLGPPLMSTQCEG